MHGGEVIKDRKKLGKKRRSGAPGLLKWHGCLWRHRSRRKVGKRGEGRGGKDNRATSNTLCLSPGASFIRGGAMRLWRHSSRRCVIVCMRLLTCIRSVMCAEIQQRFKRRVFARSVHVSVQVMGEQAATVHLTLSGGDAELELLEGRETGSSSLHTSLFKGTIKVWQKCQCCRQGTGLWMSVLLRSTSRASLPRRQKWVEMGAGSRWR